MSMEGHEWEEAVLAEITKQSAWEPNPSDEAYTAMRDGCFKDWEEFARFVFDANKKLRERLGKAQLP